MRTKYYIYKINEVPKSRTNNTTNLCLVKVSELTNLIEEDNEEESQNVDGNAGNAGNYVNFDSDAYINTLFTPNVDTNISVNSSVPQSSKSVFKNLLEKNDTKTTGLTNHSLNNMIKREELVDLVKNRLNNKYCITYIVIHSYYIKLLIKTIKDNTTHSMNCEVLTPEFTKCLLKLECIWSSMTNSTMNEVLTNYECKTIYETLIHYITHCYDDNSRDLVTQTFLNNYKNDYKKANTTYTYYYDQTKIKLEKAQDDDFIKSHDFSFLNNGGVKYGINNVTRGHPIFLLLKITKKAIGSSINSTITFNLNSIVCMYNVCKFVCSDYNIFESIDSSDEYKFINKLYNCFNSAYNPDPKKGVYSFKNYSLVYNDCYNLPPKYKLIIKNILSRPYCLQSVNPIFKIKCKLIPYVYKANRTLNSKMITYFKINIRRDILEGLLSGKTHINVTWVIHFMCNGNFINDNKNSVNKEIYNMLLKRNLKFYSLTMPTHSIKNVLSLIDKTTVSEYNTGINNTNNFSKSSSLGKTSGKKLKELPELLNVKPFKYQLDNVNWMIDVEDKILNGEANYNYIGNVDFFGLELKDYFDESTKSGKALSKKYICENLSYNYMMVDFKDDDIINWSKIDEYARNRYNYKKLLDTNCSIKPLEKVTGPGSKYKFILSLNGGILSDEVGLGKTLSSICLILANITRDLSTDYKTGETTKYYGNNLIITPNRLVSQWYLEFKKYLKPELFNTIGIKKILSLVDIKKDLYDANITKYNIYIVSDNFVSNQKYIDYLNEATYDMKKVLKDVAAVKPQLGFDIPGFVKTAEGFKTFNNPIINDILEKHKLDNKKKFNIFKKWNRIYVDECHETFKNTLVSHPYCDNLRATKLKNRVTKPENVKCDALLGLKSNFKWLLSATPFEKTVLNLNSYINFLNQNFDYKTEKTGAAHQNNQDMKSCLYGLKDAQVKDIFNKYMRRNTKKDIKGEVDIPIFTEQITYLNQNSVERNIYLEALRTNDTRRLLKLCTHLMLSDGLSNNGEFETILSIEDIKNVMVTKYKVNYTKLTNQNTKSLRNVSEIEAISNLLDILVSLFSKYDFSNSSSSYYMDDEMIAKSRLLLKSRYGSSYYSRNGMSPSKQELSYIYLNDDCIKEYISHFDTLESNINVIIPGSSYYESGAFKLFIVYNIYLEEVGNLKKKIESEVEIITKNKYEITRLENQIKIFENSDFVKESVKDPCSICFSDFEDKICITSCRHILCDYCIKTILGNKQSINCPFCRTPLTMKDINFTSIDELNKEDNKSAEIVDEGGAAKGGSDDEEKVNTDEEKIQKYGTKLAYLLDYLGEIFKTPSNRVIIFSQYDDMLKLIGKVLDDFKIKNIFIKGNIMSITKKIEMFKTDPSYRVIMLSSERSSSGSNLTEATHIILADVINGTPQMTKDIECQAIGRAVRIGQKKPVIVKRILMKNTIEEEIYLKNKYDMADLQL
jgi:SNF2 family DNA or RNA helicase